MTTAATSLLGLALPVTGELQGTWGTTVNDSITSLLDTAVAGTTTLSTDADVTLTTTTLAANQARQAILLCSGARTAQRTITAPAQSKIYTIINATTGGYAVKLVGVGPTTGVTIAAGASAQVAWNGSDFVVVGSTTANSLTVSGNLTVNGTSTLTGAATLTANPTLSAGTANGVAYLNGSKVVTTGTALTFDGTNLGVGGTASGSKLHVQSAGGVSAKVENTFNTGASYFQAKNTAGSTILGQDNVGAYLLTDAALPILFYVNNSEQMRLTSTGLGIGTSSPSYKLDVNGALNLQASSTFPATGMFLRSADNQLKVIAGSAGIAFAAASGASTYATIDSSGNLGLGVTPSAWGSGWKGIDIGSGAGVSSTSNTVYLSGNAYNNGTNWKYINSASSGMYYISGNTHAWHVAASGTAGNTISFTQAMTLDASGNLLVGTTSSWGGSPKMEVRQSTATYWCLSSYQASSSSGGGALLLRVDSTAVNLAGFYYGGSVLAGTITTNGTGVTYGSSSDYRLKENVAPIANALNKIAQLKPVTYKWKSNQSDGIGFLAHELQSVFPDAVTGEKDQVDADGKEVYQNVDAGSSSIIATLTAAIQEQQALIQTLTERITALEGAKA